MSDWQFFPGEGLRQSNQFINVTFTEPETEIYEKQLLPFTLTGCCVINDSERIQNKSVRTLA
jgi:hypothetical protein